MAKRWQGLGAMRLLGVDGPRLRFGEVDGQARLIVSVLEPDVLRVQLEPWGSAHMTRTWGVVGRAGDAPYEGRDREDLSVFSCPNFLWQADETGVTVHTERMQCRIDLYPLTVSLRLPDGSVLLADHPTLGYRYAAPRGMRHYLKRQRDEVYYGLGEVSGPLDKHHRRYRLSPTDALGYQAELSDPLYKHIPIVLSLNPAGQAAAILYDTASAMTVDLGAEIDNYHGPYRYVELEAGELDYYLIAGPELKVIVRRLHDLTGYPPLPPRWTLGYLGSTMHYTDAEDPATAFREFVAKLREHALPCSGFHLSSGYSMADDGKRYVFCWNRRRIPDPAAALAVFGEAGLRTLANIKPALLTTHPDYAELAAAGAFVQDERGEPHLSPFWGGEASYLDFTNPKAVAWWTDKVCELLALGIDATWNDNNEFQLDDEARCAAGPAADLRPVLTQLMNRASRDAQRRHDPKARDWQLTRSAMLGTQRYAQTWSGDNYTSWHTLKFNIPMGLGLSLCAYSNYGHDVGGFAGPKPEPELLVRWLEHGVLLPRLCIHSWNDDGSATEPWMYPEVVPLVRQLLRFREALTPYLYTLLWWACSYGEPITRPLVYSFQDWQPGWRESAMHLLGEALLAIPVTEPGLRQLSALLPPGRWLELHTGRIHQGGVRATLAAPLGMPPLLLREGHALPLCLAQEPLDIVWLAFPSKTGELSGWLYWDDGHTRAHAQGAYDLYELRSSERLIVHRAASGLTTPQLAVLVPNPAGEIVLPWWPLTWRSQDLLAEELL